MTETAAVYTPGAGNEMILSELVEQDGLTLRPCTALNLKQASYVLDTLWGVKERSQFYIGDLLNFCKETMGELYAQLVDETRYSVKTLQNYMWVCDRVRPNGRWETLSFDHHSTIARLDPEDQDRWLQMASEGGWSAHRLREEIRGGPKESKQSAKDKLIAELQERIEQFQAAFKSILESQESDLGVFNRWVMDLAREMEEV